MRKACNLFGNKKLIFYKTLTSYFDCDQLVSIEVCDKVQMQNLVVHDFPLNRAHVVRPFDVDYLE